ncbi:MAG TPA: LysM domain-containing protein [Dehalococcoidia bacterium]|jgi:LysM repeat protein|nr:LysM domain-containing protein [Dehalococcoidia bacterium]
MECYACDQEAIERCARCGNAYCADHGADPAVSGGQASCADCMDPAKATPSGMAFRASLLGLFVASVLALWLIIRPPSLPGESSGAVRPVPTGSGAALPTESTPSSPSSGPSPEATAVPEATPEASAEPTAEPAATPIQYTIQDGDTISGIAQTFGITTAALLEYNGLTEEDAAVLQPGDVISIPQ